MEKLTAQLNHLLDTEQFEDARIIIENKLAENPEDNSTNNLFLQIELYGFLVDIGCALHKEDDITRGIQFMETNAEALKLVTTKGSYYYNLANAKHGLAKIFYSNNRGIHPIPVVAAKFKDAIDLYWMSYKSEGNTPFMIHQILINLSSSLMTTGRIIEALQILDMVLREAPAFPQALVARGEDLEFLSNYTNSPVTIALFTQIYLSYKRAIETNQIPPTVLQKSQEGITRAVRSIEAYGFSVADLSKEIKETKKEYADHSPFRKFCIDNFLTLNEHSIYCNCVATSKDELQIGIPNVLFKGEVLPKLELLLNRIKSEFGFARWSYYKSETELPIDYDMQFSDLLDGEIINSRTETLRTSYRICYGILDKIALGICKMYKTEGGNIFFERFWMDKNRKPILDAQRNFYLNALYSIASDLNTKTGELKHFKNWRNKLEHNLLILKDTKLRTPDQLNIFEDEDFVAIADINEFREKTLLLLQLTRAAIFSFVYCVRLETITKQAARGDQYHTIRLK